MVAPHTEYSDKTPRGFGLRAISEIGSKRDRCRVPPGFLFERPSFRGPRTLYEFLKARDNNEPPLAYLGGFNRP